jgi:hypothetical protein
VSSCVWEFASLQNIYAPESWSVSWMLSRDVCFFSPALRVSISSWLDVANMSQKLHSLGDRRLLLRLFLGGVRSKGMR